MTRTILLALALVATTSLSHAEEPEAPAEAPVEASDTRELMTTPGVTAYQAGDYATALSVFEEAYRRASRVFGTELGEDDGDGHWGGQRYVADQSGGKWVYEGRGWRIEDRRDRLSGP